MFTLSVNKPSPLNESSGENTVLSPVYGRDDE